MQTFGFTEIMFIFVKTNTKIMINIFQIDNINALQFEMELESFDLTELITDVIERDFRTEFHFKELNDEEIDLIENIINDLK